MVIVFIGFMESVSVAKSLAAKRRQIEPNQELVALGMANIAAGFTGGYPVPGGFSRSVVNSNAGAKTGVSSAIAAMLIGATLLFLTPLFYYLPQTVLAAVILVAVSGLLDFRAVKTLWRYDRSDASAWLLTFSSVLFLGVGTGILVGIAITIALFLWRTSRPHMAVVGRIPGTEIYRNVTRHETEAHPGLLLVRIDGSLYFANTRHFQDQVLCWMSDKRD
jgi:SulP family sulfate permease